MGIGGRVTRPRRAAEPAADPDLLRAAFPLTAKYDRHWVADNALGENALCQAESLLRHMPLRAGMRVLDLGCGRATSSIFLAREYGVEVWAADPSVPPGDNWQRVLQQGCESHVFPLNVDARQLPFASGFFDAVIGIDSFLYFGTDERFLAYLVPFLKPGGYVGIVDIAFTRELRSIDDAPRHLRPDFEEHWSYVHTMEWWRQHWEKTGLVDVRHARLLPESDALLRECARTRTAGRDEDSIMRASRSNNDGLLSLFCHVARKRDPEPAGPSTPARNAAGGPDSAAPDERTRDATRQPVLR